MKSRAVRSITGALSLAFVASAWFFLAPQQLGGPMAYTVTTGNSMEPLLHEGDLAIVKEQDMYGVGDAVAYRSHQLGRTVLHRIVAGESDRYIFKGDNNDFLDPEKPAREDLVGEIWLHVPKVGFAIRFLQTPIAMIVGAFLVVASLGVFGMKKRKRDAGPRHSSKKGLSLPEPLPLRPTPKIRPVQTGSGGIAIRRAFQALAGIAGLSTISFLVLGTIGMSAPDTTSVTEAVPYEHSGSFSYEAPAPGGPAYDGPNISLGEPVFLRLVDDVNATFRYGFETDAEHDLAIDGDLAAKVGSDNGFVRTIALRTHKVTTADGVTLTAPIDLHALLKMIRDVERTTGVEQSFYTLAIQPSVYVIGTVATRPFEDSFTRTIKFRFDDLQLQPIRTAEGQVDRSVFEPSQGGSLRVTRTVPTTLAFSKVRVSVSRAPRIALIGGGVSLILLLAAGCVIAFVLPKDETARIRARYSSLLVPVQEVPTGSYDSVDVPDMDTLARLAHQFEELVLHYSSRQSHSYMVFHGGLQYRYRTNVNVQPFVDPALLTEDPLREAGILG